MGNTAALLPAWPNTTWDWMASRCGYVSCRRFPKLFQGLCATQYELDCHLYDRPGTQLSWIDLFGAYANVDPGKPLRPDAGRHGRRLVVAQPRVARESPERVKQHCAKLDLELLDDAVALKRIAFVRDANGRKRLARVYAFEFTVTGEQRHPGTVTQFGAHSVQIELAPYPSRSRPHRAPTMSSRCSSGARSTTAGATDQPTRHSLNPACSADCDCGWSKISSIRVSLRQSLGCQAGMSPFRPLNDCQPSTLWITPSRAAT